MQVRHWSDCEDIKIEVFPHRGELHEVRGISMRWLSSAGDEDSPEYGLRFFTAEPGGEVPLHDHFYVQTMFILTGEFDCYRYHDEEDEIVETVRCGPGDAIFVPSMERHGMRNLSDTEPATFLCCICNVHEDFLDDGGE
jgi:quercetin dioxygenase-like cupin family protein